MERCRIREGWSAALVLLVDRAFKPGLSFWRPVGTLLVWTRPPYGDQRVCLFSGTYSSTGPPLTSAARRCWSYQSHANFLFGARRRDW